ncbi:hypothetical protein MKW98_018951 [Papaver atlanticum]|uniref:Uncharacterized protein n=1 Tax=Papaver atlanticum TaxID=357466 RepID=A0AAD4TJH5_9MAGN|nr:hypothetical protein MKW98_018951 [Papaver atlanticum]
MEMMFSILRMLNLKAIARRIFNIFTCIFFLKIFSLQGLYEMKEEPLVVLAASGGGCMDRTSGRESVIGERDQVSSVGKERNIDEVLLKSSTCFAYTTKFCRKEHQALAFSFSNKQLESIVIISPLEPKVTVSGEEQSAVATATRGTTTFDHLAMQLAIQIIKWIKGAAVVENNSHNRL